MNEPSFRKARLGHFFDGEHRINVVLESGRLCFNRHRSRKVTYATVPWLELYHASVGQLPLEGMAEVWGLKPQAELPPAPVIPVQPPPITCGTNLDGAVPVQPNLIDEGITP